MKPISSCSSWSACASSEFFTVLAVTHHSDYSLLSNTASESKTQNLKIKNFLVAHNSLDYLR
jgi:hypothetical protein